MFYSFLSKKNFYFKVFNYKKMSFKIYTKTGDKGTSGVLGGKRFSKNSQVFNVLGTIDELNSYLGVSNTYLKEEKNEELRKSIENIQNQLIKIGSHIASNGDKKYLIDFDAYISNLESTIDKYESELEPLKKFILPGGGHGSSFIHLSRTVCRRVEREVLCLVENKEIKEENEENIKGEIKTFGEDICPLTLTYFNRLSDFLFVCARKANNFVGMEDVIANNS